MHFDQSGYDAKQGVKYTLIFAGARKVDYNRHAKLSDRAYTEAVAYVNKTYDLFVNTVARNRGMNPGSVRGTESGLFYGEDAVKAGLADGVRTFDEILLELKQGK